VTLLGNSPFFLPENMVHHTMPIRIKPAPNASSSNNIMAFMLHSFVCLFIVGTLTACGAISQKSHSFPMDADLASPAAVSVPALPVIEQPRSRWLPVAWTELPGFGQDTLFDAWNAWVRSCERTAPVHARSCSQVRQLSLANANEQRQWIMQNFQPYRVESLQGPAEGLLTGYFEPILQARRQPGPLFQVPIHRPPSVLATGKPWFSRQEMDTLPEAQLALQDRVIGYLSDPIDALILHIQGSGRLQMTEPDGTRQWIRVAYAGTNGQPYRSVGRWLLDQGLVQDASWPGIKAWLADNPQRVQELLWANPRVVFFNPEPMTDLDAEFGPRGAQGVALTPGRSIAVDPGSIPYGTPVWLASQGPQIQLQKLVLAQDTGTAIVGAVRADYFAGWGEDAAALAGRLRQNLQMWVLWPK
jgi:membrane-bound lytic murein transglycosylase A